MLRNETQDHWKHQPKYLLLIYRIYVFLYVLCIHGNILQARAYTPPHPTTDPKFHRCICIVCRSDLFMAQQNYSNIAYLCIKSVYIHTYIDLNSIGHWSSSSCCCCCCLFRHYTHPFKQDLWTKTRPRWRIWLTLPQPLQSVMLGQVGKQRMVPMSAEHVTTWLWLFSLPRGQIHYPVMLWGFFFTSYEPSNMGFLLELVWVYSSVRKIHKHWRGGNCFEIEVRGTE